MATDELPRIRRTPLPDTATLIVRGGILDPGSLQQDALRFARRFAAWNRFGISGFCAADSTEVAALGETKLHQFAVLVVFQKYRLESAGIAVIGTFRTPHVTLTHTSLEHLVDRLRRCTHMEYDNPYHEASQVRRDR
jgi:hypothetical protein